jgi:hypothetical protein
VPCLFNGIGLVLYCTREMVSLLHCCLYTVVTHASYLYIKVSVCGGRYVRHMVIVASELCTVYLLTVVRCLSLVGVATRWPALMY